MRKIIVTGNGTDVGKTVVCAILMKLFDADYWKPIQCGLEGASDTQTVQALSGLPSERFHKEAFRLKTPASPHRAAAMEGVTISSENLIPPQTSRTLLIETAGGLLVPIHSSALMVDVLENWDAEWIVVSKHYLGSINHTLLTLEALAARGQKVLGVIFNGPPSFHSEEAILSFSNLPCLGKVFPEPVLNPTIIKHYVEQWTPSLQLM